MSDERTEVFRGHVDECLQHLGDAFASHIPNGSKGAERKKKPLADFCGVRPKTVTFWFHDPDRLPTGETLIKLMCYLDMADYRVIELERLPQARRNFAELVGYGIISINQAAELVGYTSTSTLFQVLLGHTNSSEERDRRMWDVWMERREELQLKKDQAGASSRFEFKPWPQKEKQQAKKPRTLPVTTFRPLATIHIMSGLLGLLEDVQLEQLTENDLRILCGASDTVHQLLVKLNAISSYLVEQTKLGRGDQ